MRDLEENDILVDTPLVSQNPTLVPPTAPGSEPRTPVAAGDDAAEIVLFAYGVAVFFGFDEMQERDILEDVHGAGTVKGARAESEWEIEECHYAVSRLLSYHLNLLNYNRSMTPQLLLHAYITTFSVSVVVALKNLHLGNSGNNQHSSPHHTSSHFPSRTLWRSRHS